MALKRRGLWAATWLVVLTAGLAAQSGAPPAVQQPTFRVRVDLVTTDVIPRDAKGNFVSDLTKDEFEIYEDGVKQQLTSMTMSHGGRITNVLAPPPVQLTSEGLVLPARRTVNDVSGRIFVFFVDDLHLQFHNTGRVRELFKKISKSLVHEGDMFGIVATGTSAISTQMTYDKKRLDEAIERMTGSELKPEEIINGPSGGQGPTEVRFRAHVAFSTVNELLRNLEKIHDRRKALVYVSDGYDFNPFQDARLGLMDPSSPFLQNDFQRTLNADAQGQGVTLPTGTDSQSAQMRQAGEFSFADLARELGEVTRQANRSNVTMYTIDPRGLVGMPDVDQPIDPQQWNAYIRNSQDSLRVLAEETGGIAVVNSNDYDKALKRIDAETSDYYILGYYSTNPDPTHRRRKIDIRVTRKGITDVAQRKEYVLRPQMQAPGTPPVPEALPVMPESKQP
ncbi:MAG: VWA domain-containing protein [Acidobacteriota bacterium]